MLITPLHADQFSPPPAETPTPPGATPLGQAAIGAVVGGMIWGVDGAVVGGLLGASSGMAMEASKEGRSVSASEEAFDQTQVQQQSAADKFNQRQSGTVNRVQAQGKVYQN